MSIGIKSVTATHIYFDQDDSEFYADVAVTYDMSEMNFDFENYDYYLLDGTQVTDPKQTASIKKTQIFGLLEVIPKGE